MSIYNKEFSRAMATFRPVMGNEHHIQIAKRLKSLSDNDKKLETKINGVAGMKSITTAMHEDVRQILYLLKLEGDKSVDKPK